MLSAMTPLGSNISYFRSTFGIYFERSREINMHLFKNAHCLSTEQLNNAAIAIELQVMYDVSPNVFTKHDVTHIMLNYVCTS